LAQPTQVRWHDFFSHHHLVLDREEGLRKFVEDVNGIFFRSGLAYKLTPTGVMERTVPAPMAERFKRTEFRTGDYELDDLLNTAIARFLLPTTEARQDALEKLWDAFERLKTIEAPGNKRAAANMLIDKATASAGAVFRAAVEEEFRALTKLGNELRQCAGADACRAGVSGNARPARCAAFDPGRRNPRRPPAWRPNSVASVTSDRYVSIKGLGISRSTEGSWNFRGPFVWGLCRKVPNLG
jgi:hypothetical protein